MKRPLVAVRRATGFDRQRLDHPLFWPLERAAGMLAELDDFPPVEALGRVFAGEAPVRFVPMRPRRRRGVPFDDRALYDARIDVEGEVPTRPRCWHDLMNALVWGTFPLSKRALHARQHRALRASLPPGARALPPARTPELDALAILDEGGVVVAAGVEGDETARLVVFGHAIYESLALGVPPAVVAGIDLPLRVERVALAPGEVERTALAPGEVERRALAPREVERRALAPREVERLALAEVDRALAGVIGDSARLRAPSELRRLSLTCGSASAG